MATILHGYWRSSAAYRVRIGLNLKGLPYDQVAHDLRTGEQRDPTYRAISPQGLVPALDMDGQVVTQSLAILEWLEEVCPAPALLPQSPAARALVRSQAAIVACDVHPLNNLRVLKTLRADWNADDDAIARWVAGWVRDGLGALETLAQRHGEGFCFGDSPTIADCCLIPQLYNARRFDVDLSDFATLLAIDQRCAQIDAFARAAPAAQPDADGGGR